MSRFVPVFLASFFISFNTGAILYTNSSLLAGFFKPDVISFLFLLGALGNIILFLFIPKLIAWFGKRALFIFFLILTAVSTLGLSLATAGWTAAIFFVVYSSLLYIILYCLDIWLEEISMDARTGEIRGAYIALTHAGLISGLVILSLSPAGDTFSSVYLYAAFLLMPPVLLALFSFTSPASQQYQFHHRHALLPFGAWWKAKSIRRVTLARFTLEFFYAFMTIYTPLYLHRVIGFEWHIIGVMFIIMLLPFILFQWPVGKLADYLLGEKELMILGFIFMIVSLFLMPQLKATVALWAFVLFLSRVGASLVEITTDSYFFKHISVYDIRLLSIFRLTRPASVILGAAVGALALNLFSFEKIFFVLAIVVFFGLKESLLIRDTL